LFSNPGAERRALQRGREVNSSAVAQASRTGVVSDDRCALKETSMAETPGAGALVEADRTPESPRQRAVGWIATAVLALAGLYTLRDFLPAIVWALVIAIGLWPLFQHLALRWPKQRHGLLPALVIAATLLVLALPLVLIGYPIFRDAHEAAGWLEQARTHGVPPPPFLQRLPDSAQLTQFWQANLAAPGAMSLFVGHAMQGSVLEVGRRFGAAALHRLAVIGFMLLALFFVLRHADTLTEQLRVAGRRAVGSAGERVGLQVVRSVQGTVNGLVLVGLGEGLILGVAYWIAGVPHPALFGLVTALLAMIPFGAYVAVAIAALALLVNDGAVAAMIVAGFGVVVTFAADHFVRPVLIGGATRLPFLWVLLGILGGIATWGLVGLFVGPALLSALLLLWREYVGERQAVDDENAPA
jgi:predicted PurR-regulated permease PerM